MTHNKILSQKENFGLYIHWPFCLSKCPYCDFNSHVINSIDQKQWKKALLKELDYVGNMTRGRTLTSVFFGGGTPSLMPAKTVQSLIDALGNYWVLDDSLEITLEGNPNSIDVQKYKDFKSAGINRVSVGIQSLRSDSLKFLGRLHSVDDSKHALDITRTLFDRSSFDLIYALPGQSLESWNTELLEALDMAQDHLSLYQLVIEPGTAFYTRHQRGEFQLPSEETSANMFTHTREVLASRGYDLYEVSNFAKPGSECRHNVLYWDYDDYACIGPGAHGRLTLNNSPQTKQKIAIKNHRAPDVWMRHVMEKGQGQKEVLVLPGAEQITEHLLMNLRLVSGVNKERFFSKHGKDLMDLLNPKRLSLLKNLGYIVETKTTLKVTDQGMLRLDAITSDLLTTFLE